MSYTTLESEQIVSKKGNLSIDVFSTLEKGDNSNFRINCNSILKDGMFLNCPNGGIKLESKIFDICNTEHNIRTDAFSLEILKSMDITSLSDINISAIQSIKIGNNGDGLIHNINNLELKLINKEVNSKIIINSPNITLLNKFNSLKINKNLELDFEHECKISSKRKTFLNINSLNNSVNIDANVNITGDLKFTQLLHQKIKKLKLEDITNFLEFGNKTSPINDWKIGGIHANGSKSSVRFESFTDEFIFSCNDRLSKIKAGELSIFSNENILLKTSPEHTEINNVVTNKIKCFELEGDTIHCNKLFVHNHNILSNLNNIYNNKTVSLSSFIKEKNYVLMDCDLKQNLIVEGNSVNIYGYYRTITIEGIINMRNITHISRVENINFINAVINITNINQLTFNKCLFNNTRIISISSKIVFNNCNLDELSFISSDMITIIDSEIACNVSANNYLKLYNNNIVVNNTTLRLEKQNIIYQINNNIYKLYSPIKQFIVADTDILLCDSWYLDINENKNIYETKLILKK